MKKLILIGLVLSFHFTFAQLQNSQSTTGPVPPANVDVKGHIFPSHDKAVTKVISNVPAYIWYRGCGPTSVGMVVGYYDNIGYGSLIQGDAHTQTALVDSTISSNWNYNDYCLPIDNYPTLLADRSALPAGSQHANNCIADFMKTSQSYYNNYYGWSWSNDIKPAFENYVAYTTNYMPLCTPYSFSSFPFDSIKKEVDSDHPMTFLVDSDGDGATDHFITVIGYKSDTTANFYGCLNTWDTGIHWYEYKAMSSVSAWGVYNVYTYRLNFTTNIAGNYSEPAMKFFPNPVDGRLTITEASTIVNIEISDISGKTIMNIRNDKEKMNIDMSLLTQGIYLLKCYLKDGSVFSKKITKS